MSINNKKIDLKIGFQCNNKCHFCVQGEKRGSFGNKPYELIKKEIDEAKNYANDMVLTGGEATMHKHFFGIISYAKLAGFRHITIQTNGRMFAYKDFCVKTVISGASEFCMAVHGCDANTHDSLTNCPGSFNQVKKGIINLKNIGVRVVTNTVITTLNFRTLPKIAELLVALGVDQFQFAFPHISGSAWDNRSWLIPKKTQVMPYVIDGLKIGLDNKKTVMTEAIPYCFMKGYENLIAENIIPETKIFDAGFTVDSYEQYRKMKGKVKHKKCRKCSCFQICEGPWKEYPEIFGWGEFVPLKLSLWHDNG